MKLTLNFKELSKQNTDIAGGKGASLGEMTQAGIPVPPGFVVLSTTFETFIKEADLIAEIDAIIDNVNHKDINSVETASEKIQALIKNASMPENIAKEIEEQFKLLDTEYVAVRSSATAEDGADNAWAGQLDSYLNTKKEDLLEKVQHCWASLFTPRAIFYRFEKGLHTTKISVAVVVQKMVNSEISGIAFSVHPVTEDRNQMIIEAGFGLGEAIVSGQVTPDSYVVEKEPRRIIDTNINTQTRALYRVQTGGNEWIDIPEPKASSQVLTESQVLDFADLIMRIENHYGFPCDIEWAYEGGKFYIVQSRPITTLLKTEVDNKQNNFERWIVQNKLDFLYKANYDLLTIDLYYQTSLLNNSFIGSQDTDYIIRSEKGEAAAYYPVKQEDKTKLFDNNLLSQVIERSKLTKKEYFSFLKKYKDVDLNVDKLAEFFDEYCSLCINLVACFRTTRPVYVDALVERLKEKLLTNNTPQEFLSTLLISEKSDDIRSENTDWVFLLNKGYANADDFSKHILKYPWLFPSLYDMESALKKISERYDTDLLKVSDKIKEVEKTKDELDKHLSDKQQYLKTCQSVDISKISATITDLSDYRTFFKLTLSGIVFLFRDNFKKISSQANLQPNIFYNSYTINDVKELLLNKKQLPISLVEQRNNYYVYIVRGLEKELVSDSEYNLILKKHFSVDKKSYLIGASACAGVVSGVARVLSNSEIKNLTEESLKGKILVTTMTDPSIMPFIRNCLAFVTDEGGLTSHAAIVSRELNIPCIVGTKNGTQIIGNGSLIEVDADNGVVKIIESKKEDQVSEEIKKLKWEKWLERPFYAFILSLSEDSFGKESVKKVGIDNLFLDAMLFQNNSWFYNQEVFDSMDINIEKYLDEYGMKGITDNLEKFKIESEKKIKEIINTNYSIEDKFKEVYNILSTCMTFIWLAHGIESYYTKKLKIEVPKYVKSDVDKFIGDASFPKKKNLNTILDDYLRSDKSDEEIVENAGWTKVRDGFSEPYTVEEIKKLREETKSSSKHEEVEIPEQLKLLFEEIKELVFFRTERTDIFYYLLFIARPIFKEIAQKHNIPFGEMKYYRAKSFLNNNPEKYGEKVSFGYYKENVIFKDTPIIEDNIITNSEVKGIVAYRGKVRGIVKKVKNTNELDKILVGDVLVTQMTFPSFISAMQKAVAFVTDEGGITCHAAIIAREMKKPCIIGTKIATQILKDGDLVEVDADNGVVRVIEGKKEEKIFDKFISRYYCIMHLEKYNQFLGEMCEEIGIPKFYPIFVYDSKKRLSTIYYNTSELDTLIKGICKKTDEDLIFREKVISEYKKYFNEVKEYLDLSIKINSKKEFEKFSIIFENYLKYNAYNWVLSGANLLSGETKEESEKLRKETEVYASKRDKVLELFAKELFHNDELDVFFMSSLEFINEKYDIGEIKERENGFLWCNGEIILKRNIPQFLDSKKFNLREPISDNSSIIKGTIANKGCVSGIVKIIYTERDLFRITSEEDILVSPMTRPEFIPAIKKAKAIITDEGGITCHAAIVSRELNKPCIIGTKIATQVLKDGDIVEVDANNGIVRVIK